MASPSVTYTFSPSSTIASSQVNQNFTDIINALTDATKSLSIDGLTVAGTALFKGNVTLGDATTDTVTYVSRVASSIDPSVNNTYDCGDASYVWANVYATNLYGKLATAAQANVTSLGTLTSLAVSGNVAVDTNTLFVDATNNAVGFGTVTVQAKIHLHAPASSTLLAGPNIVATVDTDVYPVFSTLFTGHDAIDLAFDAYYDGGWKSSDAGSNYRISKSSDYFGIWASGTNNAGSAVAAWQPALFVDTAGRVCINSSTMLGDFNVVGTSVIHDTTATTGQNLVFVTQNSAPNYFIGINTANYLTLGTAGTGAVVGSLSSKIYLDTSGRLGVLTSDTSAASLTSITSTGASVGFMVRNEDGENIISLGQDASKNCQIICRADGGSDIILWVKSDAFIFNERGADADFRIESDTLEYAFFLDGTTGYIGINESEPDTAMHISNASGGCVLTIDSAAANGSAIAFNKAGVTGWTLGTVNADNAIGFYYSGSYRFYIDSSGNVGIGTAPSNRFHVYADNTSYAQHIRQDNTGGSGLYILSDGSGTSNYGLYVESGSSITGLAVRNDGNVGIGTSSPTSTQGFGRFLHLGASAAASGDSALILSSTTSGSADNKWEMGNNSNGDVQFAHSVAGTGSTGVKMTIDSNGNVGIGVSPDSAVRLDVKAATADSSTYSMVLRSSTGNLFYVRSDGQVAMLQLSDGSLSVASGIVTSSSDSTLKTPEEGSYGLKDVLKLKPRMFKWKDSGRQDYGFFAQEVKEVIDEAVGKPNKDGLYNYWDRPILATLTKAIQELSQKHESAIQELSAKLDEANAKITALENK